ncbi:MAG: polyprenyl synthetase family protein [Pseudomonadota bacterium]
MDFKSIVSVVAEDFAAVDAFIRKSLESEVPLINEVGHYIVQGGGKRLRPLVCLLTARACGYAGHRHVDVASIIELLHTATLLHDDVVDDSGLRRGRATANARWDNPTAVLVGDYLISKAFQLMVSLRDPDIMDIMSAGTCVIAEGEVLQLINQRDPNTTEERYMQVIYGKTAKLFETAAETGASLGTSALRPACAAFARHLGAAFQIIDDVLDYTSSAEVMGKNVGDDLAEGKPTLPLIQAIKASSPPEADLIRQAIRTGGLEHLQEIVAIVQRCGALDYTRQRAETESALALAALAPLQPSGYKSALENLTRLALIRVS